MKTKLNGIKLGAKCLVLGAMVAVGLTAVAAEPEAVQLWAGGPYWATVNVGAEKPTDYGILTNFNDAAKAVTDALGAGWRLPTRVDFENLLSDAYCSKQWTQQGDVKGYLFTSKSDLTKSIFLPAAGFFYNNQVKSAGEYGFYWTSTVGNGGTAYALSINKDKGSVGADGMVFSFGFSIRAVKDPPSVKVDKVESVEPWVSRKGTIKVEYTLGDVDAKTDYKVAFEVTAGGQTASVTNDATKLTNKQYSQELDTASAALFGKQVTDTKAKVKVSLIATKAKEVVAIDDAEFWLGPPPVAYLDCDGEKMTNAVCTVYEVVTNEMSVFDAATTYVVTNDVTVSMRITVNGTVESPTRLILCDGAKLTAQKGVNVTVSGATTNALVICGQENGTGALEATGGINSAGIGGGAGGNGGIVTINGGTVTANGGTAAAGIGGGQNATDHGTVTFGAGAWIVKAGAAAPGAKTAAEAYATDHSAKYVHIELGYALKILAVTGYTYVVSNATEEISGEFADGTNTYVVVKGSELKVYFTLDKNYQFVGTPTNPMEIGEINASKVIAIEDLPTAGLVPIFYVYWDEANKRLMGADCKEYEEYTDQMTLDAGKTYVVMANAEVSSRITVNGTPHSPTRLILCDGAKLMVDGGIGVASDKVLVICGQANGTGALEATGGENAAGIGGGAYGTGGMVTINGGTVTATGGDGAAGIGGGKNATNHGTVIFAGKTLVVMAGADAASAAYLTTAAFAANHSAKYAHIEPGCMLKIPTEMTGCSYVVSNLTAGAEAEIAPAETVSGGVNYALSAGMKVGIYAVPADGYRVVGEPYVIGKVAMGTTLSDVALPKFYAPQSTVPQVITYHGVLARTGGFAQLVPIRG